MRGGTRDTEVEKIPNWAVLEERSAQHAQPAQSQREKPRTVADLAFIKSHHRPGMCTEVN